MNQSRFLITDQEYLSVISALQSLPDLPPIESRAQRNMEQQYVLLIPNGDIILTKDKQDDFVGNALTKSLKSFFHGDIDDKVV